MSPGPGPEDQDLGPGRGLAHLVLDHPRVAAEHRGEHVRVDDLARRLAAELARLGLPDPAVEVRPVDTLERQPTGKVRRFRPLEPAEVSRPA